MYLTKDCRLCTTEYILERGRCVNRWCSSENWKEGNVLFNDALNIFYLQLYGVRHMVKDHSDSERGNPLPPYGLLFPIIRNGSFICIIQQTGLHIPRCLLHQSRSTGWNEKLPNGSTMKDRSDSENLSRQSATSRCSSNHITVSC